MPSFDRIKLSSTSRFREEDMWGWMSWAPPRHEPSDGLTTLHISNKSPSNWTNHEGRLRSSEGFVPVPLIHVVALWSHPNLEMRRGRETGVSTELRRERLQSPSICLHEGPFNFGRPRF